MTSKRLNTKNTKAEILAAYNEIANDNRALETQLAAARKTVNKQNGQASNTTGIQNLVSEKSRLSGKQHEIETIVKDLNQLQLNFGGAASSLSEQLISEVLKLQEIQGAVAEESEQLATLHGLQVTDDSLNNLIEEYEINSKTFQEAFEQRQEDLELAVFQSEKAWKEEQEDHQRAIKGRNELQAKRCQRDTKEYTYDLTLQRKLSDKKYEQAQKRLYREMAEFQAVQEKQWAEREMAIAEREKEFEELRTKVEGFSEKLEKSTQKAREEGKGIAQHQAKIKSDLAAQEVAGQKRTYELRIEALQDKISTQDDRSINLSTQLDAALQQVQDLAVKAIEGASNLNSLRSIREIAIEQAKNPSKGK